MGKKRKAPPDRVTLDLGDGLLERVNQYRGVGGDRPVPSMTAALRMLVTIGLRAENQTKERTDGE